MEQLDQAHELLHEKFGLDGFRTGQLKVVTALLEGRSAAAIFPTGSGKSLCYQLPALMLPGLTLVVSPLIALMKDQIDGLQKLGIAAERLDSSLDEEQYRQVTQDTRSGKLKMLFIAPERLSNERFLSLIGGQRICLLAVDEAHCISSWGHNFRPEYLKLSRAAKELKVERVLALTATATPQVSDDIAEAFGIDPGDVTNTGFHRPNLELRVTGVLDEDRDGLLVKRLRERPAGPTIVYVSLQRDAERVATHLRKSGFDALPYHAGLNADLRAETQDAFMAGRLSIICATIAFGMGVDKSDIRYVYHYHLAKGYESYQQEIGRAGRDGEHSICELFACPDDCTVLENFAYGDTPDQESVRSLVGDLFGSEKTIDVAIGSLSRRHDIRQLVVSTVLARLELMGLIRSEGHYYGSIRWASALGEKEILAHYDDSQVDFLRKLFRAGKRARKWVTLDIDQAMSETGHGRDVILRALDDLQGKGLVELQMAGYHQTFRRLVESVDVSEICDSLMETFEEHEAREIDRIDRMIEYAARQECLTAGLLEYFGEEIGECGHCAVCLDLRGAVLPERSTTSLRGVDLGGFGALVADHPSALARPRQQARFLCGLNSPAVSASRDLRGNPLFGCCADVPFAQVLAERGVGA